jgi:Skp family chaperone for outer membrane proteins
MDVRVKAAPMTLILLAAAGLGAVGFGWGGAAAVAERREGAMTGRFAPVAPVIAIVDVQRAIDGLDEHKERLAEFVKSVDSLKARAKTADDERAADDTRINIMAAGPDRDKARKAYLDKYSRARFELKFTENSLAEQEVDDRRAMYLKLDAAVEELAKQRGYQMVLASDEKIKMPDEPGTTFNELRTTIQLKRMLYTDPGLDITDELVLFMNNQWKAGAVPKP